MSFLHHFLSQNWVTHLPSINLSVHHKIGLKISHSMKKILNARVSKKMDTVKKERCVNLGMHNRAWNWKNPCYWIVFQSFSLFQSPRGVHHFLIHDTFSLISSNLQYIHHHLWQFPEKLSHSPQCSSNISKPTLSNKL